MSRYLSDEWFEEMEKAAALYEPSEPREGRVRLRETITDAPSGPVSYVMTIDEGRVSIDHDDTTEADVTFSQDYETAAALHRGQMTTHEAFFEGKVRVSGHLNTLLDHADLLKGVAPAFDHVRNQTTY